MPSLWKHFGFRQAFQTVRMETSGRRAIRDFVSEFSIDCDLERNVDIYAVHQSEDTLLQKLPLGIEPMARLSSLLLNHNILHIRRYFD